MEAEIIAVGTEILMGQIVNTNASYMAKQLTALGITSHYQQVVGDNGERLDKVISVAEDRADLVILIGGLGPTEDDLTKQTLAQHIGKPLVVNFDAIQKLIAWGEQQQKELTPNNRVQAMLPLDAEPLKNAVGLAVGAMTTFNNTQFVLLPGPPKEFEPMVQNELVPRLAAQLHSDAIIQSRVLRFFGIGESALVTQLKDLIDNQTNPTLATYIKDYEVTLRITASAGDEAAANALLDPLEAEIMHRVGQYFYGYGDSTELVDVVVNELKRQQLHVTAAESLTAGAFQATLGDVSGVSAVFDGGFVTYAPDTKASFLKLDQATLEQQGIVSEATAKQMATGALTQTDADIAISFTGVAGPDELEGQPAGTVWIGIAMRNQEPTATLYHFPGSRHDVRYRAVKTGLFDLLKQLKEKH